MSTKIYNKDGITGIHGFEYQYYLDDVCLFREYVLFYEEKRSIRTTENC